MKVLKKILVSIICSFTILTLISCSVKNNLSEIYAPEAVVQSALGTNGFARSKSAKMVAETSAAFTSYDYAVEEAGALSEDRKITKTVSINAETKAFDESINWFKTYVEGFSGIIDSSYIDSGNMTFKNYRKNANFNVRIPAEKLDAFLSKIGDNLNVTFHQENITDVTEEYDDTESRIASLKIEEESLLSMLKKAKTVEEMIKVEDKLSSVRTELRNISNRLKRLDRQVTYSTVNVNITEVIDLTEPQVPKDDFSKDTLVKQMKKNLEETKLFIMRCLAYLFTHLPAIALGLITVLVFMLIIMIFKSIFGIGKKAKKKSKPNEDEVEVEFFEDAAIKSQNENTTNQEQNK